MKNVSVGDDAARPVTGVHIRRGQNRAIPILLIGTVLLIAALWAYMAFRASTQQTLDQHVQTIGAQLKCPVCQGESVADSPSDRAQQMRGIIRQKLQAGASDQQILQFFSDRYGEQIVWSPQWWGFSLLTWVVPIVLLLGGLMLIYFTLRDWRTSVIGATTQPVKKAPQMDAIVGEEDALAGVDAVELAEYRVQLERELGAEDVLFRRRASNARQKGGA